ncbi:PAS domain-containing sensor histidine kinase [Altererythrobacter sp. B11]|uniref:PAS domain-containing sensor histidine kinase n=1 Tax=Altererythrobacter sp. B11 TaxID=2060312 RepID=UPI000DC72D38|nr:PAS domain-containing sensor histidine kinase [Altererythrobacter sp. B11]BBC73919.1 PAS domain-containing sensor histidine kinase [Altererythrobacter sp. B11]
MEQGRGRAGTIAGPMRNGILVAAVPAAALFGWSLGAAIGGTADTRAAWAAIAAVLLVVAGLAALGWRSARREAAARLAEAEARAEDAQLAEEELRLLLEGARQYAIFLVDREGRVSSWNAGAERLYGWTSQEVLGRHCALFYAADEAAGAAQVEAELTRALAEESVTTEDWQVRKDRSEFLASLSISPLRSENGTLRGFARVIYDATERRAVELAIQKREEHLNSILATVPDAMIVIDERGRMTSFSSAAERLFGYSEAEVIGRNVSMLMPSPDREQHDSYIERYLHTGERRIVGIGRIVTGQRSDGSTFPMKLSVGEAISRDQRLFTGFVQDLTERREFESQLEAARSELIHVSRLSAMGTMASTLAHELNQPLTAISVYGEAAREMLGGEGAVDKGVLAEVFGEISGQALRAGEIVRRLRQFVARGEVMKTVQDVPALINEASALALVGARDRGISAQFFYAPDATPVFVDRVQIQQVLVNLMRNAMEAMEGRPVRRLSISTGLAEPGLVLVTVGDTGPGIAPEIKERLFEAFASTKADGMGLGLSICRTIIEAHGGRITVRDAQGGGTEFLFTLPRAVEAAA